MRSPESRLRDLKPALILIGSAAEGTRLVEADEIDVFLKFSALSEHALRMYNDADALAVVVPENAPVLSTFASSNRRILDYSKFFDFLLKELCSSLKRIRDLLPAGLTCNVDWVWTDCSACERQDGLSLVSFCRRHLPPMAHTKIGPCLFFTWTGRGGGSTCVVTVDLVPLYFLETESDLPGLFDKVFWSLYQQQPKGWQRYCEGIAARDRILPGVPAPQPQLQQRRSSPSSGPVEIAIKFLNYSDRSYVIRPGQALDLQTLEREEGLRETYIYLKALKRTLDAKVSSYFIKKAIFAENLLPNLRRRDLPVGLRLQLALKNTFLRPAFQEALDMEEWRRVSYGQGDHDTIPLRKKPFQDSKE